MLSTTTTTTMMMIVVVIGHWKQSTLPIAIVPFFAAIEFANCKQNREFPHISH